MIPAGKTTVQGVDMLFFGQEPLERLDAYQHLPGPSGTRVEGVSSTGARKLAVCANATEDPYAWSDIRSFSSLKERTFLLRDEDPSAPRLTGTVLLPEGSSRSCRVSLQPALSRVTIRSIACDFSERSYAGAKLREVRAYLTYAADECHPFDPEDLPTSWINAGRLDENAVAALPHPEMVLSPLADALGGRIRPELNFYCYPNPADGTQFGRPVTRLVIEGELEGTTCYYPIGLPGLEGNVQYNLDITLTRAGTKDPDIPAETGTILLECRVMDWDERDWNDVHFR